ncbi:GNAT family N-acetyltransferase [Pseudarthrobacter sp. J1738]|uniref:GNAT family N-acetyltransferase n=1 Tax=unclassified Pseudarthrobacter TaxID=2647000 RepID=UPI003D29210A
MSQDIKATSEDQFAQEVSTVRNEKLHRYEVRVGDQLAGFAAYLDKPGHIDFTHTETSEDFRGRGLAGVLVRFALDDVVASGKRIIPHCPYVARFVREHEGYEQYVDWPQPKA